MAQAISNTTINRNKYGTFRAGPQSMPNLQGSGVFTGPNKNMSAVAGVPLAPYSPEITSRDKNKALEQKNTKTQNNNGLVKTELTKAGVGTNASSGSQMYHPSGLPVEGDPATYSGVSKQSMGQQGVRGLFPDVASSLATFDPFSNPVVADAYAKAQELNKALAESKRNEARGTSTLLRQAIPLGDQEGQARVLQDQYLKQQQALGEEFSGQSSLFGAGFTGTQQQLSGLGTVAGLAPEATRYETFGGGGLAPQNVANQLAQQVRSGQMSPDQAIQQINSLYGGAGATFLNNALSGSGYDYITGQAQSGIKAEQEGQYQAYQSAHQQALNLQSQLKDLITTFGLNPSDLTIANRAIQEIASQTSDPRYQTLMNYLSDVASRYSQILTPPGGTATDTTRAVAASMINSIASGAAIIDVMNSLDQQAQAVAAGVRTIGGTQPQPIQQTSGGGSGGEYTWDTL